LDLGWRLYLLELHAGYLHSPLLRRLVEHHPQASAERLARGECFVEREAPHHVTDVGLGELIDRQGKIFDLVKRLHRVNDLVIDNGTDFHRDVISRDDGNLVEPHYLLAHVDEARRLIAVLDSQDDGSRSVEEGDDDIEPAAKDR